MYKVVNCVVLRIVCVYMCTVLLPLGVNPVAVNKYINLNTKVTNLVTSVWFPDDGPMQIETCRNSQHDIVI